MLARGFFYCVFFLFLCVCLFWLPCFFSLVGGCYVSVRIFRGLFYCVFFSVFPPKISLASYLGDYNQQDLEFSD